MTIKQQGGVFGRNPSFNDVDAQNLTAASVDINGGTIDGTAIGGSTPAAIAGTTGRFGDLLKVNTGTEPDVVPPAGTVALFQRNSFSYSGASIGLLAGVNGPCIINFGDTADQDIGSITYNCALNTMAFTANTTLGFTLTSSGNIAFPSGQGIDFSATAGTGTSELFDDYEEGTWTATVGCTGNATTTTTVTGYYTKVGRQVTVSFRSLDNIDTTGLSGFLSISLPFTCISGPTAGFIGALIWDGLTYPAGVSVIFPYTANGASTILFATGGSGAADGLLGVSAITSGTTDLAYATMTYFTA